MGRPKEIICPGEEDPRMEPSYWAGHTLDDECPVLRDRPLERDVQRVFLILTGFLSGRNIKELSSFTTGTFDAKRFQPETIVRIAVESLYLLTEATSRPHYFCGRSSYMGVILGDKNKCMQIIGFRVFQMSSDRWIIHKFSQQAQVFPGLFEIGEVRHKLSYDGKHHLQKLAAVDLISIKMGNAKVPRKLLTLPKIQMPTFGRPLPKPV